MTRAVKAGSGRDEEDEEESEEQDRRVCNRRRPCSKQKGSDRYFSRVEMERADKSRDIRPDAEEEFAWRRSKDGWMTKQAYAATPGLEGCSDGNWVRAGIKVPSRKVWNGEGEGVEERKG